MKRRDFLRTIPILVTVPQLSVRAANGSTSQVSSDAPTIFRWVSLEGGKRQRAYEDLWDPEFRTRFRTVLRQYRQNNTARDHATPGATEIPRWDLAQSRLEREMDWVSFTRQLPQNAPGKKRYVQFLLSRYGYNLDRINQRYSSGAHHPSDLLNYPFVKVDWQHREIYRDDQLFLQLIRRKWSTEYERLLNSAFSQPLSRRSKAQPNTRQSRFAII